MILTKRSGINLGADFPQTVVDNATLLKSEVARVDVDIQACKSTLPATFVTGWEVWRDTTVALADSVQNNDWYEVAAGGLWIAVKRVFSGSGIRDTMDALTKWREQAKAKGCAMNGPAPQIPPMPLSDVLMWTGIGIGALGFVGIMTYGIVNWSRRRRGE